MVASVLETFLAENHPLWEGVHPWRYSAPALLELLPSARRFYIEPFSTNGFGLSLWPQAPAMLSTYYLADWEIWKALQSNPNQVVSLYQVFLNSGPKPKTYLRQNYTFRGTRRIYFKLLHDGVLPSVKSFKERVMWFHSRLRNVQLTKDITKERIKPNAFCFMDLTGYEAFYVPNQTRTSLSVEAKTTITTAHQGMGTSDQPASEQKLSPTLWLHQVIATLNNHRVHWVVLLPTNEPYVAVCSQYPVYSKSLNLFRIDTETSQTLINQEVLLSNRPWG
jgi:hypothetical protein